jgi:hypothetical protein
MDKPKREPTTTFLEIHRAPPEPAPPPPRAPVYGEPGFCPPPPEPVARDAPISKHFERFAPDPATAWRRRQRTPEGRGLVQIVLVGLLVLVVALGLVLWLLR